MHYWWGGKGVAVIRPKRNGLAVTVQGLESENPNGLFPVSAELYRRACQPRVIEIETVNLSDLWHFDSVPKEVVRGQLLQLLEQEQMSDLTCNNLIVLCGYWVLWGDSCGQGLALLNRLMPRVRLSDEGRALNYFGFRAKAEAIQGNFAAALDSLEQGIALINDKTPTDDLWFFSTRITLICNRANCLQDSLYFARISYWLAKSNESVLQISRSRFGLGNCLMVVGAVREGEQLLQNQLSALLKGTEWIESINLPIVPLFLANAKLQTDSPAADVDHLVSLSGEFMGQMNLAYTHRQTELTKASFYIKSNDVKKAKRELASFAECFVEVGESDLWSARRALEMFSSLKHPSGDRVVSQLADMACAIAPPLTRWAQVMFEVKQKMMRLTADGQSLVIKPSWSA